MTVVAKKSAKKQIKKVQPKRPMFDTVSRLRKEDNLVHNTFTIHNWDGSTKVQHISKKFVYNEKGRLRSTDEILMDLNAIVHDSMASHFSIGQ